MALFVLLHCQTAPKKSGNIVPGVLQHLPPLFNQKYSLKN